MILFFLLIREKKKKKYHKSRIKDLYTIVEPIKYSLDTLKIDKTKYLNAFNKAKEETKLYSEHILNMVDAGILLIDEKDEIIYQNNWFNSRKIDYSLILKSKLNTFEIFYNEKIVLVTTQKHDNYSVFILNDITELKELEQEVLAKEKLAYLGEMSASIAHEFKNSLAVIKGFARILQKRSDNSDIVRKISIDIDDEINYFYGILVDYLSYSKEINLNISSFSVKELIDEIKEKLFFENRELIILNDDFFIDADRDKIKQVLINLIKNGIEVSNEEKLKIELSIENNKKIIKIVDKGSGISKENKDKIFNPFFTTKEHGTGLGLAITYNIIIAHNGKIEVLDNFPKGAIFKITLNQ